MASGIESELFTIGRAGMNDAVPARLVINRASGSRGQHLAAVIIVDPSGTAGATANDETAAGVERSGADWLFIDVFNSGTASVKRDTTRFFSTYNRTDTAERVQDILTAASYLKQSRRYPNVQVFGRGEYGPLALLAFAVAGESGSSIDGAIIDWNGFDSSSDQLLSQRYFTPGLRRAGDFRTALALGAPRPLSIYGVTGKLDVTFGRQAYRSAGARGGLRVSSGRIPARDIARRIRVATASAATPAE